MCDAARYAANPRPSQAMPAEVIAERIAERRGDSKICSRCGESKSLDSFSLSRQGKYGPVYRSDCKACCSTRARQWFTDNAERAKDNRRRWNLLNVYDLTPQQYTDMLREQGGVCAICGGAETNAIRKSHTAAVRMSVDHCHDSGKVRGLLCNRCNRAIGLFGDDPVVLRRAIAYLMRAKRT